MKVVRWRGFKNPYITFIFIFLLFPSLLENKPHFLTYIPDMTLIETVQDTNVEDQGVVMTSADLDLAQSTQLGYGTRNVVEVSLNIVNATVGAGVIGLPFALALAGFVPGLVLSIIVGIMTTGAIYSMIVCGLKVGVYSFAGLAEYTMGQFGFYTLNFMLFIQSAGSCISYFICKLVYRLTDE